MNILIRIENREDIARIEESLNHLPHDLYFVRDDGHMLLMLRQTSFDFAMVGFSTEQNIAIHSIRLLKEHEKGMETAVVLCGEADGEVGLVNEFDDDFSSDFHEVLTALGQFYKVEVLWQRSSAAAKVSLEVAC